MPMQIEVEADGFAVDVVVPVEVLASIHSAHSVGNFRSYVLLFVFALSIHLSVPLAVSVNHRRLARVLIFHLLQLRHPFRSLHLIAFQRQHCHYLIALR